MYNVDNSLTFRLINNPYYVYMYVYIKYILCFLSIMRIYVLENSFVRYPITQTPEIVAYPIPGYLSIMQNTISLKMTIHG